MYSLPLIKYSFNVYNVNVIYFISHTHTIKLEVNLIKVLQWQILGKTKNTDVFINTVGDEIISQFKKHSKFWPIWFLQQ